MTAENPVTNQKILIIEEDEELIVMGEAYLSATGYETVIGRETQDVSSFFQHNDIGLVILDLDIKQNDGFKICQYIREIVDIPIIVVSVRHDHTDVIRAFGAGADDYVKKPFDPSELTARVLAHMREYRRVYESAEEAVGIRPKNIEIDHLRILTDSWQVFKDDEELHLPNREFLLLKFLAENPNVVFSKDRLFGEVWGYEFNGDSATVMVHINRIREKIEDDPKNPKIIETVRGAGYRLNKIS